MNNRAFIELLIATFAAFLALVFAYSCRSQEARIEQFHVSTNRPALDFTAAGRGSNWNAGAYSDSNHCWSATLIVTGQIGMVFDIQWNWRDSDAPAFTNGVMVLGTHGFLSLWPAFTNVTGSATCNIATPQNRDSYFRTKQR